MNIPHSGMIFISHANPEDNHFARWLSLQLAKHGYPAWCDLTHLLGGEDFWLDIESALRQRTAKFVFVLSHASNQKQGTLQELSVAISVARQKSFHDFIIPLRIDNLPYAEFNIQLTRLNAIDFSKGWAPGLNTLLAKLERDHIPHHPHFSPSSVATWWKNAGNDAPSVTETSEIYYSNWFAINLLPDSVHLHTVNRQPTRSRLDKLQLPYSIHNNTVLCFANSTALGGGLNGHYRILKSHQVSTTDLLNGISTPIIVNKRIAHNAIAEILRKSWNALVISSGLKLHPLSNKRYAAYLPDGFAAKNSVSFLSVNGNATQRKLVGYRSTGKSRTNKDERSRIHWHFAVEMQPGFYPSVTFMLVPHLLFSNDGQRIMTDSRTAHRLRRRYGKNWWNAQWRDRTLSLMSWLAKGNSSVEVSLGPDIVVELNSLPITFCSPVAYTDPKN